MQLPNFASKSDFQPSSYQSVKQHEEQEQDEDTSLVDLADSDESESEITQQRDGSQILRKFGTGGPGIKNYELLTQVGKGGFSRVILAR